MPDFDIKWLVKELDTLGLKLTSTRRLDGSFSLNRWRSMAYWDNAEQAEALWAEHVGDDSDAISAIAEYVAKPTLEILNVPSIAPMRVSAGLH
jgi:hypothetical protein